MKHYLYERVAFTYCHQEGAKKTKYDGTPAAKAGVEFYQRLSRWMALSEEDREQYRVYMAAPDAVLRSPEAPPVTETSPVTETAPVTETTPAPEAPSTRQRGYCVLRASTCRLFSGRMDDLERAHVLAVRAAAEHPGEVFEILESLGSCYVPVVPTTDWAPTREPFQLSPQ